MQLELRLEIKIVFQPPPSTGYLCVKSEANLPLSIECNEKFSLPNTKCLVSWTVLLTKFPLVMVKFSTLLPTYVQ